MNGTTKLGEVHEFGKLILSLSISLRIKKSLPSLTEPFVKRDQRTGGRIFVAPANRVPSNKN